MVRSRSTLLRQLISQRRLTREQTIEVLNRRAERMRVRDFALSVRQLDRWLAGDVVTLPRPSMCRVIEEEFGQSVERLLAIADDGPRSPGLGQARPADVGEIVRTAAAQSARFGQWADSLGVGDLAFAVLWQRLGQLAVDYVHAPMVPVFTDLVSLRDDVFELLAAPDPAQARDLYLLAGTTCGLLAHASGNLGHLRAAHTQACAALICARKADHPTLAAWVLGVRALQSEWTGQPDESLRFAAQAQSQAAREQLPSTVPAWLAAIEARALARRGNRSEALAALQRAADNRSRVLGLPGYRNEFDQIGGILTFTEVKQHYYAGRTLLRIGEFSAAQSHAQLAITGYAAGPADQRSYGDEAIAWADLALARASGAVPDLEGAAEALAVIREQPADRCLPTLLGPLRDLSVALSEQRVRDTRQAAEMRGLITDITTACQRPAVGVEA